VHLDAPVNSACQDQTPTLSKDGLALYFTSTRRGGLGSDTPDGCQGSFDLWVAGRASRNSPWETPVNLGSPVNTSANEAGPALSHDGRLLFFYSFVGTGQRDIYASRRDPNDLGWETPLSLGADVNTTNSEAGPTFVRHEGDGDGTLYFYRGDPPITTDLYAVRVTKDGETLGPAVVVPGLNSSVEDNHASVSFDGREIFFNSRRPGSAGFDLWVATRGNVHDAWSAPVNLGAPVNSQFAEFHPSVSFDGRTLVFISGVARGGLGGFDIWMATRTPSGR
jgi:Tol biopolymer transport system component